MRSRLAVAAAVFAAAFAFAPISAGADIVPPNAATAATVTATHVCGVDARARVYRCFGGRWEFAGFPAGTRAMVTSGGARRFGDASGSLGVGACPRTNIRCSVGTGFALVYCPKGTTVGPFYNNGADNVPVTYRTSC